MVMSRNWWQRLILKRSSWSVEVLPRSLFLRPGWLQSLGTYQLLGQQLAGIFNGGRYATTSAV
jgi:hypothetical protein